MSMIVFNKKLVTEHNQIKKAWNQLLMQRESFNVNQNNISAQYGGALEVNQAALISKTTGVKLTTSPPESSATTKATACLMTCSVSVRRSQSARRRRSTAFPATLARFIAH